MPELWVRLRSLVGRGEHIQQQKPLQEQRLSACQGFRCVALPGCSPDECTCLESEQSCIRGACHVCADLWYSCRFGGERRAIASRQLQRTSSANTLESLRLLTDHTVVELLSAGRNEPVGADDQRHSRSQLFCRLCDCRLWKVGCRLSPLLTRGGMHLQQRPVLQCA